MYASGMPSHRQVIRRRWIVAFLVFALIAVVSFAIGASAPQPTLDNGEVIGFIAAILALLSGIGAIISGGKR
jgi:hypothetical protein